MTILMVMPTNKAKVEIETQEVTVETKKSNFSM